MPGKYFVYEDSQSLEPPELVTRDSLGYLAVQILAAKNDLSQENDYDHLIRELYDIIIELQQAHHRVKL